MTSFEVVLDNAKMQVHCNDETPLPLDDYIYLDLSTGVPRDYSSVEGDGITSATFVDGAWQGNNISNPDLTADAQVFFPGFRLPDYNALYAFKFTFDPAHPSSYLDIWRKTTDDAAYPGDELRYDLWWPTPFDDDGNGTTAEGQVGPDSLITTDHSPFYHAGYWDDENTAEAFAFLFTWDNYAALTSFGWKAL